MLHPLLFRRCRRETGDKVSAKTFAGIILLSLIPPLFGCRTFAPIHLWQPPQLRSVAGEKVVLMEIAGPAATADGIRDALIDQASGSDHPRSSHHSAAGGSITLLLPDQLRPQFGIELVSNVEDTSGDLLVAAAARRSGVQYMLRGEIMHATGRPQTDQQLSVVWRLVGLDAGAGSQAKPISIDQSTIERTHPDLMANPDPSARLYQAMARQTLGLVHESVIRQNVDLAHSVGVLGSAAVRRGNALARLGNWPAAEEIWMQTLDRYPFQTAAWINASIAAAARQDFEQAKQRVTRAIQLSILLPVHRRLAEETLVWLELQQRDYVKSFDLPDPAGGWRVTHTSNASTRGQDRDATPVHQVAQ